MRRGEGARAAQIAEEALREAGDDDPSLIARIPQHAVDHPLIARTGCRTPFAAGSRRSTARAPAATATSS
jgi:hypothetical protein